MLQYQKIDVSEGIDVNKTSESEKCELCHYWFLKMLDSNLKNMFVMYDLLTMAYSLKNIVILSAKGATFRCDLLGISKNEGLKRLNNSVTSDKGVL